MNEETPAPTDAQHLIKQAAYELGIEVISIDVPTDPLAVHKFTLKRKDGSIAELHIAGNTAFPLIHKLIADNSKSGVQAERNNADEA